MYIHQDISFKAPQESFEKGKYNCPVIELYLLAKFNTDKVHNYMHKMSDMHVE